MRRAYSLFFLFLILLNAFGYYQALVVIENQHFDRAVKKIAENENEINGNLLLRIPMSLPYGTDDAEYRSAVGEVVIDGQLYHFVKQKMFRDTLYVVCLNDAVTTKARNDIADYSKSFTDQHQKSDAVKKATESSFSNYYVLHYLPVQANDFGWTLKLTYGAEGNDYQSSVLGSVFHPPC